VPAAVLVGQSATDERADGCPEDQDADDEALGAGGEAQVVLHRRQRAVDHAGVVAEQQPAERGDDGDQPEPLVVRAGRVRGNGVVRRSRRGVMSHWSASRGLAPSA